MRRTGFPWSPAIVRRARLAAAGTVAAATFALRDGVAVNLAGGTHHAFSDHGSGYCVFNDLAVSARVVQQTESVHRVLIIDLDVHQGDGTAHIFQNDPSVVTFSMHCEKNFPRKKQRSDLDTALPEGTCDTTYLDELTSALGDLDRMPSFDLALYNAGVDPHRNDRLGRLDLSDEGLRERDQVVLAWCARKRIPTACVLGGGYDRPEALAPRHACLIEAVQSRPS